jgi:hypothetical protein
MTPVVFVDVDDTLIRSVGTKRIPVGSAVAHVRELHRRGAVLYCWSTGGADYARASAEEVGLADSFVGFLPKPNVLIDDQDVTDWRRLIRIHPSNCGEGRFDDYRATFGWEENSC